VSQGPRLVAAAQAEVKTNRLTGGAKFQIGPAVDRSQQRTAPIACRSLTTMDQNGSLQKTDFADVDPNHQYFRDRQASRRRTDKCSRRADGDGEQRRVVVHGNTDPTDSMRMFEQWSAIVETRYAYYYAYTALYWFVIASGTNRLATTARSSVGSTAARLVPNPTSKRACAFVHA
jgi:hypothetical protein